MNKTMHSTSLLFTSSAVLFNFIDMNKLLRTYIFQVAELVFIDSKMFVCHVVFFFMVMDVS